MHTLKPSRRVDAKKEGLQVASYSLYTDYYVQLCMHLYTSSTGVGK